VALRLAIGFCVSSVLAAWFLTKKRPRLAPQVAAVAAMVANGGTAPPRGVPIRLQHSLAVVDGAVELDAQLPLDWKP